MKLLPKKSISMPAIAITQLSTGELPASIPNQLSSVEDSSFMALYYGAADGN